MLALSSKPLEFFQRLFFGEKRSASFCDVFGKRERFRSRFRRFRSTFFRVASVVFLTTVVSDLNAEESKIRFDFEDGSLQGWDVVEGRFDQLTSSRPFFHNFPTTPYNKQGKYYLSTVEQKPGLPSNDAMTGVVESPVMILDAPETSFLIGVGCLENSYVAVYTLDGREHKRYRANLTEEMIRINDSLPELVGKPIYWRLVDWEAAPWGHVAFDDFQATGRIDVVLTRNRAVERTKEILSTELREKREVLARFQKACDDYDAEIPDSVVELEKELNRRQTVLDRLGEANLQANAEKDNEANVEEPLEQSVETNGEQNVEQNGEASGEQNVEEIVAAVENQWEPFWKRFDETMTASRANLVAAYPELKRFPVLYVVRKPYESHYHAIDTLFSSDEFNCERQIPHKDLFSPGGSLKLFNAETKRAVTLIETPRGSIRDPDVGFDADKIVMAIRDNRDSDYQLWEARLIGAESFSELLDDTIFDSTVRENYSRVPETEIFYHPNLKLVRLTRPKDAVDFDPIYLPDDSIVFASTREPKYNMCSRDVASDLYRMNGDGSNIYQITKSTLFEHNPVLLPDGRICYHRWEYVDRNFGDAHALWTVSPNGLNQAVYWGNNTAVPGGIYNPVFIEETGEMLCVFGPHHGRENGALAIVDRRLGVDGPDSVVQIWPESFRPFVRTDGPFDCDTTMAKVPLKYEDPYAIDADHFLVARTTVPDGKTALYLLDRDDNEFLLQEESDGIYDPRLVRSRKRGPLLEGTRNFRQDDGICYVADVYQGTNMRDVAPGSVAYLRVVESPEKRNFSRGSWNGQGYTAPAMNWHSLENKRILGTVPVEEDGSAAFRVPCDVFLYFQLLDKNKRMIQTMRSGTVLQSGETVGCIGCHEDRLETFTNQPTETPLAMRKEPRRLEPWLGERRTFGFMTEVQPVFDKHCVECHDYGKPAGEKLNLASDRDLVFNTAYVNLWNSPFIKCVGAGPAVLLDSHAWGSSASPLIRELDDPQIPEHIEAGLKEKLSDEDRERLCAWLDLNGVYYPCYESAYPESQSGRTPLAREETARLGELLNTDYQGGRFSFNNWSKPEVCFERPELSPCLERLKQAFLQNDPAATEQEFRETEAYREALSLIRTGAERLKERPRADMPGFVPCDEDRRRLKKYEERRAEELRFRDAIQNGKRAFDP